MFSTLKNEGKSFSRYTYTYTYIYAIHHYIITIHCMYHTRLASTWFNLDILEVQRHRQGSNKAVITRVQVSDRGNPWSQDQWHPYGKRLGMPDQNVTAWWLYDDLWCKPEWIPVVVGSTAIRRRASAKNTGSDTGSDTGSCGSTRYNSVQISVH